MKRRNLSDLAAAAVSILMIIGIAATPLLLPGRLEYLLCGQQRSVVLLESEPVPLSNLPEEDPVNPDSMDSIEPDLSMIKTGSYGTIDASLARAGVVTATFTRQTGKTVKCVLSHPDGSKYTYTVEPLVPSMFTLTGGDGDYVLQILEQTSGNRYTERMSYSFHVTDISERIMYSQSCFYINYENAEASVALAEALSEDKTDIEAIDAIYQYVSACVAYDHEKARTIKAIYAPDMDETLETEKGICMDYAALVAGMLRSRGIPCRMLFGDVTTFGDSDKTAYHAWVEVWSGEGGWLEQTGIYMAPETWVRLDPTLSHTNLAHPISVNRFIANDKNYGEPKFTY